MAPQGRHLKKTSRYYGVSWNWEVDKWRAEIRINKKQKYLGYFDDEQAAADAYDTVARKHGLAVNTKLHDTDVTVEEQQAARGHDFKGVYFHKQSGKYRANIWSMGKETHLGYFDTPEDAARAWDAAAKQLGRTDLNFPNDEESDDDEELDDEEELDNDEEDLLDDDEEEVDIDHDHHEPPLQPLAPLPVTAYTQAEAEAALAALPTWRRVALKERAARVRAETRALGAEVGAIVEELKASGGGGAA